MNLTSFSSGIVETELALRWEPQWLRIQSTSHHIISVTELRLAEGCPGPCLPSFLFFLIFYSLWNPYFLANSVIHSKILVVDCPDQFGNRLEKTHVSASRA